LDPFGVAPVVSKNTSFGIGNIGELLFSYCPY